MTDCGIKLPQISIIGHYQNLIPTTKLPSGNAISVSEHFQSDFKTKRELCFIAVKNKFEFFEIN